MLPGKIKFTILACWILISCSEVLSTSALKSLSKLEREGSKLPKHLTQEEEEVHEPDGVKGTVGLFGDGDEKGRNEKQEIHASEKARRGKSGAYGGGNIAHRPRTLEKSVALLPAKPRFFVSNCISFVSFAIILVFHSDFSQYTWM